MPDKKTLFLRHLGQTSPHPVMLDIQDAEGVYIKDTSGKSYIDFISGISVSNLGHNHPKIVEAVKNQADQYLHVMVYGEHIESPQVQFAEKLSSTLPRSLNSVYLVNSGAEATETAMKLAKRVTGRKKIIHCKNSYHGSTQGALSIAGQEELKNNFRPLLPGIESINFNNLSDIDSIDTDTAAIIIEPIQGEGGVKKATPEFLEKLHKKCQEKNVLIVFDEIQTGFGRTGSLFAFQQLNLPPDILLIGKAMGGGLPLGGVVSSAEILNTFTENPMLGHITTFGGHPLSCAAALASLSEICNMNLKEKAAQTEKIISSTLRHPEIKEIRGSGWFWAVELNNPDKALEICRKARENGLIVDWFLFNPQSLRLAPPITISEEETQKACDILLKTLD